MALSPWHRMNCTAGNRMNSHCHFQCQAGRLLRGSDTTSCRKQPNGQQVQWSHPPPVCSGELAHHRRGRSIKIRLIDRSRLSSGARRGQRSVQLFGQHTGRSERFGPLRLQIHLRRRIRHSEQPAEIPALDLFGQRWPLESDADSVMHQ